VDGEFFLQFAKERNSYREWLRIGSNRYNVSVLGYTVTSNHTHVVCDVRDRLAVANMMKLASGSVAQQRNLRKGHDGSVWEHPYHCTRIQDGRHLLNCLRYIDLNMVRAGKVEHPSQWRWCSYDEFTGQRRRYRIIDKKRLMFLTGFSSENEFAEFYKASISERINARKMERQPCWTEAVAVGDSDFVNEAQNTTAYRRQMQQYKVSSPIGDDIWAVREPVNPYTPDSGQKSRS
jgi:putative transposase